MNRKIAWLCASLFCVASLGGWALAEDAKTTDSGTPEPQKVGEEAQLLLRKISLDLQNVTLVEALDVVTNYTNVPVSVAQGSADAIVTLKLAHATLAEALRQIKDKAGAEHRIVEGQLLLALPEEWSEIDAGKKKFAPAKSSDLKKTSVTGKGAEGPSETAKVVPQDHGYTYECFEILPAAEEAEAQADGKKDAGTDKADTAQDGEKIEKRLKITKRASVFPGYMPGKIKYTVEGKELTEEEFLLKQLQKLEHLKHELG